MKNKELSNHEIKKREREDKAIDAFCNKFGFEITSYPDRENPGQGGCEAIIRKDGKDYALEHTTLDSFANHRLDNARFSKVIASLEQKISERCPGKSLHISVPIGAVQKGADWDLLAKAFEDGCVDVIKNMDPGESKTVELTNVPFQVKISYCQDSNKSICAVGRLVDDEVNPENDMQRAMQEKTDQLASYKQDGLPTILLIDSDDFALVNHIDLAKAFALAAKQIDTKGLDEVYIARTGIKPFHIYPVKLQSHIYPDVPDPVEFAATNHVA